MSGCSLAVIDIYIYCGQRKWGGPSAASLELHKRWALPRHFKKKKANQSPVYRGAVTALGPILSAELPRYLLRRMPRRSVVISTMVSGRHRARDLVCWTVDLVCWTGTIDLLRRNVHLERGRRRAGSAVPQDECKQRDGPECEGDADGDAGDGAV